MRKVARATHTKPDLADAELREAREHLAAIAELLTTISRSTFDLQAVLDVVVEKAVTLCAADHGWLSRAEGGTSRIVVYRGQSEAVRRRVGVSRNIRRPTERSITARLNAQLRTIHVADLQNEPSGAESGTAAVIGARTLLGVPLLRQGEHIGNMFLARNEVRPFSAREIVLVETFADQAVIAIANVTLFNEIQEQSRQLEAVNQELAAASQHKSEFLANMSHELRTPLNAIIGFSDVLEQRMFGELNDRQADYVRDIAGSGRHLLDLVNEILDLSKVEAGRMELEPSEFALADTVRGAVGFVRERAGQHGITLTPDVPDDLGTLVADERKVRQVLLNLLSNAVKFTPDGGGIVVSARRADGEVQVSVRDTGIGIAPEDQPKVFEEFQQVGRPSARSREGTGLGLTLAKRFIELHDGRIWVESEVGKGTTFIFALPEGPTVPGSG